MNNLLHNTDKLIILEMIWAENFPILAYSPKGNREEFRENVEEYQKLLLKKEESNR